MSDKRNAIRMAKRAALALCAFLVLGIGAFFYSYPAIAAGLCASCAGMERITPRVVVDPSISARGRTVLLQDIATARSRVEAVWSGAVATPNWVVCVTNSCDRSMGGFGGRAITLSTPFGSTIRVGPSGLDTAIYAHELSHAALHARVGVRRQITGDLPAWLDEGLAVLVSGDHRYLDVAGKPMRCETISDHALPASPFQWAQASSRNPDIYRQAACATAALGLSPAVLIERLAAGWTP